MGKSMIEIARMINKSMHNIIADQVDCREIAELLAENLNCDVYFIDLHGNTGEYALCTDLVCPGIDKGTSFKDCLPERYHEFYMNIYETRANVLWKKEFLFCPSGNRTCPYEEVMITIIPVYEGVQRLGTVLLVKSGGEFTDEEIVIAEYGVTILANEIIRKRSKNIENEARKRATVQSAVATLSYSERKAMKRIIAELKGNEGLVVIEHIATSFELNRASASNALTKIVSAGIIEKRSVGKKGIYIKILNDSLFHELYKH
jgi:transcriptional pleiotropic repressor